MGQYHSSREGEARGQGQEPAGPSVGTPAAGADTGTATGPGPGNIHRSAGGAAAGGNPFWAALKSLVPRNKQRRQHRGKGGGAHRGQVDPAAGTLQVQPPGEAMHVSQHVLTAGTALLQPFHPVSRICQHVCAFHCYAHDASRQVRAHHFCSHVNEEFRQCIIYDSGAKDAKLIGIEYIISERLFLELPDEEKQYWHSHTYEVTSGQLIALNVPTPLENAEMAKLVGTYGKTWHTWQVDLGHPLPYGPAQLMMSFTGDGQVRPELVAARDAECGTDTEATREARKAMKPDQPPHPLSDQPWRTNTGMQVELKETGQPFMPVDMRGPEQMAGVSGA